MWLHLFIDDTLSPWFTEKRKNKPFLRPLFFDTCRLANHVEHSVPIFPVRTSLSETHHGDNTFICKASRGSVGMCQNRRPSGWWVLLLVALQPAPKEKQTTRSIVSGFLKTHLEPPFGASGSQKELWSPIESHPPGIPAWPWVKIPYPPKKHPNPH